MQKLTLDPLVMGRPVFYVTFFLLMWLNSFVSRCAVGYMGFPSCQPCNCSVEGSINIDPCIAPCVCKVNTLIWAHEKNTHKYSALNFLATPLFFSHALHTYLIQFTLEDHKLFVYVFRLTFFLATLQENVEGRNCDRCKLGFYNLQGDNQRGCEKCSCMGVASQCSASTWTYQNVGSKHKKIPCKCFYKSCIQSK